jgi:hypothetical protein
MLERAFNKYTADNRHTPRKQHQRSKAAGCHANLHQYWDKEVLLGALRGAFVFAIGVVQNKM